MAVDKTLVVKQTAILNLVLKPLGFKAEESWNKAKNMVEWNIYFTNLFKNQFGFAGPCAVVRLNSDHTMLTVIRDRSSSDEIEKMVRAIEKKFGELKPPFPVSDSFFGKQDGGYA